MSEKLMPCPFCGGKGYRKILECGGFDSIEEGCIACSKCGAQGGSSTVSWSEIRENWNKRAKEASKRARDMIRKVEEAHLKAAKSKLNFP